MNREQATRTFGMGSGKAHACKVAVTQELHTCTSPARALLWLQAAAALSAMPHCAEAERHICLQAAPEQVHERKAAVKQMLSILLGLSASF